MKYIKTFELNSIKEIKIDLLNLCNYFGGMFNAIGQLQYLMNNSSKTSVTDSHGYVSAYDIVDIGKTHIQDNSQTNPKESEAISINGKLSYGYLLREPEESISFTFYDAILNDEHRTLFLCK